MDFTLTTYKRFLHSLHIDDYSFQTLENFIQYPNKEKIVILRHDIDRLPSNALVIASIEKEAGIRAGYYFRIVKQSYDENIIRQIAEMGHEIGYHYENLSDPQITQINADEGERGKRIEKLVISKENRGNRNVERGKRTSFGKQG